MFKVPNPFDEVVKKTTSEQLTGENWELIMEVCDRVGSDSERAQQCFEVVNERVMHRNANVVLYTMTLVQSMVENCGQGVRQQVASRAFTTTLTRVLNDKSMHEKVKSRILGCIQQWAFDFRQDPTLSLMEETYTKLRAQRFQFPSPQKPKKIPTLSDLERQKEEDDLQLALALSLSSTGGAPGAAQPGYQTPAAIRSEITRQQTIAAGGPMAAGGPSSVTRRTTRAGGPVAAAAGLGAGGGAADGAKRKVQVKALFDFTPTEAGELGFYKGDVIDVLDQKYRDWWRGELRGKSGIFPANFVQSLDDIRAEATRGVDAEVEVFSEAHNIEALLRMLGSIDPLKDNVSDNDEVQRLYASTMALRPKLVKLIEKYTRKKEELVQLDAKFANSIRLYDELMQNSANQPPAASYSGGYQPQQPQPQQLQQSPFQQPPQQQIQQQPPQQPPQQLQQSPFQQPPQQQQQHMQSPQMPPQQLFQQQQQPRPQQQQFVNYSSPGMAYAQPVLVSQTPSQQQQHLAGQPAYVPQASGPPTAQPQQMYYAQPQQLQAYPPQAYQQPPQQQQQQQQPAQQFQPQYQPQQFQRQ